MSPKLDGRSHQARTRGRTAERRVHHVGAPSLIRHFLDCMTFLQIAGSCPGTRRETADRTRVPSILVPNILLSPSPLYRIAERADPFSAGAVCLTPGEKASIDDGRVARTPDPLVPCRAAAFCSAWSRRPSSRS